MGDKRMREKELLGIVECVCAFGCSKMINLIEIKDAKNCVGYSALYGCLHSLFMGPTV